ncbi:putative mitochondrial carrier domain protein [Helianthus annuus]|uniref:Mitochondrial carrier domain protein n=1 Tax=Helianthus annuus TaxID=4232 RepID=A0A9K3NFQ4_HELAN|nr:putative mitochondrial carrier domain protein [Helianthus annuus]KAJ0904741.1 putative mitochondrial carrier domain protein [Helianthus annuus]
MYPISILQGPRGLYAGFNPAVIGSTLSWGLYFYFYNSAKQRYMENQDKSSAYIHLASAAEAGGLVCLFTNPVWVVKTRLQLQTPQHHGRPYSGFNDAFKTILKDEGWRALYKGLLPGLLLVRFGIVISVQYAMRYVSHGAIQFAAYEELRKMIIDFRHKQKDSSVAKSSNLLTTIDYATLGASSKLAAILATYPFQVIRARLQQRPNIYGVSRYADSGHALEKTARLEGIKGFYGGFTANLLKTLPAASITFIVYENVLSLLTQTKTRD